MPCGQSLSFRGGRRKCGKPVDETRPEDGRCTNHGYCQNARCVHRLAANPVWTGTSERCQNCKTVKASLDKEKRQKRLGKRKMVGGAGAGGGDNQNRKNQDSLGSFDRLFNFFILCFRRKTLQLHPLQICMHIKGQPVKTFQVCQTYT